ncbi:hypothetical protein [Cellulosimicrobium cellulans]|uniref:hypothetical protein n=1 Tax=Cellulosimicrobium cellulans TaxID=1710 RepID=UPI003C5E4E5E
MKPEAKPDPLRTFRVGKVKKYAVLADRPQTYNAPASLIRKRDNEDSWSEVAKGRYADMLELARALNAADES